MTRDVTMIIPMPAMSQLCPQLMVRSYVGQNHRALPDAQMVRKIVLLLKELKKPPEERNLDRFQPKVIKMLLQNGATRMAKDQTWLLSAKTGIQRRLK